MPSLTPTTINWGLKDRNNQELPAGTYLIRLNSPEYIIPKDNSIRKLTITR